MLVEIYSDSRERSLREQNKISMFSNMRCEKYAVINVNKYSLTQYPCRAIPLLCV